MKLGLLPTKIGMASKVNDVWLAPTAHGMRRIKCIHFIGIGGAGMCGIAEILLNQGYKITGSDLVVSNATQRLQQLGITIFQGHDQCYVKGADVAVVSAAIDATNPEIVYAKTEHIPVVRRAEMLGELMRYRHSIAVAGTHGKTTTTSLIASIFSQAGLDPTFVIGGVLNSAHASGKLGASRYLIAEADESDASFLHLQPIVVVLTNIDRDHLNNYEGSLNKLQAAFLEFIHNLPFYGLLITCIDDATIKSLLPKVKRAVITYGFDREADIYAYDVKQVGEVSTFSVRRKSADDLKVRFTIPGKHNILNTLAAIAVATDEGVRDSNIIKGLEEFQGVSRRFELHGKFAKGTGNFILVDDYGHHPNEVKATIEAVRLGWPEQRLIMVYQPHRYSRTLELFDQFVDVLSRVDRLILLDVYAAGETPIMGATGKDLYKAITRHRNMPVDFFRDIAGVPDFLNACVMAGDFILTQGAGETSRLANQLRTMWQDRMCMP